MQNIPVGYQPYTNNNTMAVPTTSGSVNIIINNPSASLNPNGANINNSCSGLPGQAYPPGYYINNNSNTNNPAQTSTPQVSYSSVTPPLGQQPLQGGSTEQKDDKKPMKDIVQLTDEYVQSLENYLRNPNPEIKLMGAKELMKRFREDESRKNDVALTNLLNLTLQSKYSPVKMIGMSILTNGWAQGDDFTRQLLAQIQQSDSSYGLDALDAAEAALKSAGQTIKVPDNNPDFSKEKKKSKGVKNE